MRRAKRKGDAKFRVFGELQANHRVVLREFSLTLKIFAAKIRGFQLRFASWFEVERTVVSEEL